MDYNSMSTIELRTLVRERGLAKGAAVASASKSDLIALLEGTGTLATPSLPAPAAGGVLADVIAAAISGRVKAGLDEEAVKRIVAESIDGVRGELSEYVDAKLASMPARGVTINLPELPAPIEMGDEPLHFQFAQVLAWLRADVPVWLWGPPGGGKTHLGRQLAKALGVAPYVMSIDETTTANKLLGFQNLVSGEFVQGWLYEPYKNGGLVVIDEIDTGNPGIIAGLNALLANDHYLFPNGETVPRHASFRVLACANTNGTGAVAGFTARQRLDAATLNRFACLRCEYDQGLELQIACGIPSTTGQWSPCEPATAPQCEAWVRWVQSVRGFAGNNVLVSPRPSLLGVKALRAGVPVSEVAQALVWALCAPDTVESIKQNCGAPEDVVANA